MSFTGRIIFGNAIVVLSAVLLLTLLNKTGSMLNGLLLGLVLLVGSSTVLWWLCNQAFKPLGGIVAAMEKAAAGDLSVRAETNAAGEIGRLGIAFNAMMNDMNQAMRKFFSVADLVRDSVSMVQNTTNAMADAKKRWPCRPAPSPRPAKKCQPPHRTSPATASMQLKIHKRQLNRPPPVPRLSAAAPM